MPISRYIRLALGTVLGAAYSAPSGLAISTIAEYMKLIPTNKDLSIAYRNDDAKLVGCPVELKHAGLWFGVASGPLGRIEDHKLGPLLSDIKYIKDYRFVYLVEDGKCGHIIAYKDAPKGFLDKWRSMKLIYHATPTLPEQVRKVNLTSFQDQVKIDFSSAWGAAKQAVPNLTRFRGACLIPGSMDNMNPHYVFRGLEIAKQDLYDDYITVDTLGRARHEQGPKASKKGTTKLDFNIKHLKNWENITLVDPKRGGRLDHVKIDLAYYAGPHTKELIHSRSGSTGSLGSSLDISGYPFNY